MTQAAPPHGMPPLQIRRASPDDAPRLAVLASQVWLHTYATEGIDDEIAAYVLAELTPAKYLVLLSAATTHCSMATQDGRLVGFSLLRLGAPCPVPADATAELQTLYVQAHSTGRGIGSQLLAAAQAVAQAPLWLTVNARNARAIAFYARHGYARRGTTHFTLGQGRHENHVLVGRAVG
ncbi:GNAT family N-acetyltransferase [Pseudorhodoferax sp.]|uniref:GNAT family N-acetyltransferase n=1 Tax=Pseudorhodoferax sp. TaxID=1993553 RepID=UPI002DD63BCE|nr:GNAT family N-acetyltransferase [Pseudorhodoferax sp.]